MQLYLLIKEVITGTLLNPGFRVSSVHSFYTDQKDADKRCQELWLAHCNEWDQPKFWIIGPHEISEEDLKKHLEGARITRENKGKLE